MAEGQTRLTASFCKDKRVAFIEKNDGGLRPSPAAPWSTWRITSQRATAGRGPRSKKHGEHCSCPTRAWTSLGQGLESFWPGGNSQNHALEVQCRKAEAASQRAVEIEVRAKQHVEHESTEARRQAADVHSELEGRAQVDVLIIRRELESEQSAALQRAGPPEVMIISQAQDERDTTIRATERPSGQQIGLIPRQLQRFKDCRTYSQMRSPLLPQSLRPLLSPAGPRNHSDPEGPSVGLVRRESFLRQGFFRSAINARG